jgi:hypothetical protein
MAEETRTLLRLNSAQMREGAVYPVALTGRGQLCATLYQDQGYLITLVYDLAGNLLVNQEFRSTGCMDPQLGRGAYQLRVIRVYGIWSLQVNDMR